MEENRDQPLYSLNYVEDEVAKEKKKFRGLNKGATAMILLMFAVILFQTPFHFSFLEKGIVFLSTIIVPESIFIVILFGLLSLYSSIAGLILSLIKFNLRGLILSLLALLVFLGVGAQTYDGYLKNNSLFSKAFTADGMSKISNLFTIENRSKVNNRNQLNK